MNTRVNTKTPACCRGGEKKVAKTDRLLATLESRADLSSHIVTHHSQTTQFRS